MGLARSGFVCARLLSSLGAEVRVTEIRDNAATRANAALLGGCGIRIELGGHTKDFIAASELVVVSPGVAYSSPPIAWARELGIPVISEIELGWTLCPATVIAVTGSNGKTTVTTLIGMMLKAAGKKVAICGNIGNPFCGELEGLEETDFVALEVSSFQLETVRDFKPKVAVVLNIARNHLDRHADMQEYVSAKKRIYLNQDKDDYLVLNAQDPRLMEFAKEARSRVAYFQGVEGLNPNFAAVLAVGEILGIDSRVTLGVFSGFKGIEHRMEEAGDVNGVKFINDSKATTAESTLWALRSLSCPVVLIAGGRHKGVDYRVIADEARAKVRRIVLIGEARQEIASALRGTVPLIEAATLQEAVQRAFEEARPGDCVLLSPMCSSFDMFADYEERGRLFKDAVQELSRKWGVRSG